MEIKIPLATLNLVFWGALRCSAQSFIIFESLAQLEQYQIWSLDQLSSSKSRFEPSWLGLARAKIVGSTIPASKRTQKISKKCKHCQFHNIWIFLKSLNKKQQNHKFEIRTLVWASNIVKQLLSQYFPYSLIHILLNKCQVYQTMLENDVFKPHFMGPLIETNVTMLYNKQKSAITEYATHGGKVVSSSMSCARLII